MNANAPAARPPSTWKRDLVWLIALVLAFLLGYLLALLTRPPLAPPACPPPAASISPAGGNGGGAGGGSPGAPGTPAQLGAKGGGDGSVAGSAGNISGDGAPVKIKGGGSGAGEFAGGGDSSASGKTVAGGGDGKVSGAGGEIDMDGGGGGKMKPAPGQDRPAADDKDPKLVAGAGTVPPGGAAGDDGALDDMPDLKLPPGQPGSHIVIARDFSYDRSGLPHYAGGIDKIASAMAIPPGGAVADDNTTVAEIITNDAPDAVAAWYRAQLPQDQWQMQAAPSAAEVDQNIKQTDAQAADFDKLAKDMEKTQQPGGGGQAAAMAILMKGMMAGQRGGENGDASLKGTPLDSMFGKIANMQLRGAQEGLNKMREAHLTMFQPRDSARDPRMVLILRDAKTGKTAIVISKKATRA